MKYYFLEDNKKFSAHLIVETSMSGDGYMILTGFDNHCHVTSFSERVPLDTRGRDIAYGRGWKSTRSISRADALKKLAHWCGERTHE